MRNGTSAQLEGADESLATNIANLGVYEDFQRQNSRPQSSVEFAILTSLRNRYPEFTVTLTPQHTGLLTFAKDGQASAKLDTESDAYIASRIHCPNSDRTANESGVTSDRVLFGRYDYQWNGHDFIVYEASWPDGFGTIDNHYVLHKQENKLLDGPSITDQLIAASTQWGVNIHDEVFVFDQGFWSKNKDLWKSVQDANWDDVILDEDMKNNLVNDVEGFFDCQEEYKEFGVPWKRGLILHGLPGNGKTISIKALMHALYSRPDPIPTLYVKSLAGNQGSEWAIREIFIKARNSTPCLLVFEDLDSLITDQVKSFFLNEVDGLESNEGLMMLGSTNYLARLDAGISKRPGRFDRKYHFKLPATTERAKYCDYWRAKLAKNKAIDFPPDLSQAIAEVTEGFSFAYLKEAFVTSLLTIVGSRSGKSEAIENLPKLGDNPQKFEHLLLWRVMNMQIKVLRAELEDARKSADEAAKNKPPVTLEEY